MLITIKFLNKVETQEINPDERITGFRLIEKINQISQNFVVMKVNGVLKDLNRLVWEEDSLNENKVELFNLNSQEGLEVYRHTTAHVLAYAVKNLYPEIKLSIGPVIESGFYYDIDNLPIKESDFPRIEAEMKKIIDHSYENERVEISKREALSFFKDNQYKIEIINELDDKEKISYYRMGEFNDLCRGPHLPHIGIIKAFRLQRLAGAYWRGNSNNTMLTRIYGTSFPNPKELKEHLRKLEELKANDHNKLGRELGYFITDENVGQGLPLLTAKGSRLKRILENWVEEVETKKGYEFTITPYLAKSDLYKISGHWDHYRKDMFIIENEKDKTLPETLALRPMTCPFHFSLYNAKKHSYRDLPIRYAENSTLFRNEASGEMHGLIRVRQFTLADGHIICTPEQLAEEFQSCLELIEYYLKTLELDNYNFRLSLWDPDDNEKYINNPAAWERTQNEMRSILHKLKVDYYEAKGEAAFYGPKLDIQMKNVYGKEDTIMTVQIDFALPERFKMKYTNSEDKEARPVVIHRGSLGCFERTIAMLIEKHKGDLPFWLAPDQVEILTISDEVHDYAKQIQERLLDKKIRVKINLRNESLGKKIKESQKSKIPVALTLGKKEKENKLISLRLLRGKVKNNLTWENFLNLVEEANLKKQKTLVV